MKFADINNAFTSTLTEWIQKGYTINSSTMNGTQGEIAKIDLTNGVEVIRILLESFHKHERMDGFYYGFEGVKLTVGRAADDVTPNSSNTWDTVWNNKLEILSCDEFYKIGSTRSYSNDWFGTKEDSIAQQSKEHERLNARYINDQYNLPDEAKSIVLPFVRRQPKCKSVRLSEIERVTKYNTRSRSGRRFTQYIVIVRGQSLYLNNSFAKKKGA